MKVLFITDDKTYKDFYQFFADNYVNQEIYVLELQNVGLIHPNIKIMEHVDFTPDVVIGGTSFISEKYGKYKSFFPDECKHRFPNARYFKNMSRNAVMLWGFKPNLWADCNTLVLMDTDFTKIQNIKQFDKKMMVCMEPRVVKTMMACYKGFNDNLTRQHELFDIILTYDVEHLKLPNAKWIDASRTLILPHELSLERTKEFYVSMVCGWKQWAPGHKLRQLVWLNRRAIEMPIDFYYSGEGMNLETEGCKQLKIESKYPAFEKAMFHIVVENSRETNYFTEKITDCFVTETIPIYWGCPNIEDFFDMDGIIVANTLEEIMHICNNLTEQDYTDRLQAIENNKKIVYEKRYDTIVGKVEDEYRKMVL